MEKIEVFDVLRKGFNLYKNNFSLFFKASLICFVILLLGSVISLLNGLFQNGILFFAELIFTLITMYFTNRLVISISIIARDLIKSQETSFTSAYAESKQYFWRYIGNTLLVSFPVIIPLFFIQSIQRNSMPFLHKFPLLALLAAIIGIIASYLYFAPVSVALEPNLPKRFRYSIKLVKGKLFQVFLTLLISSFIFSIPAYLINFIQVNLIPSVYFVFIRNIVNNLIYLISMPFSECVGVILFYELRRVKNSIVR